MGKYVLKRLAWMLLTTVVVAILIFTIMFFVPGSPGKLILGTTATEEEAWNYDEALGLHDPYLVQLGRYLSETVRLDFGTSYQYKVSVIDEFAARLPRTLTLGLLCMAISTVVGIPIGIICALKRNTIIDHGMMVFSMLGVSLPQFWLALLMVILFALKLHWLPPYGFDGGIEYWIMPVIAGSVGGIAMTARQTRSAVLETIRADFVTTARAKGLPNFKVIYKHMLPNAMIPIINMLGGTFAMAIGGTVVIESVFQFPGVGLYMLSGTTSRDYPVVRGCILILAIFSTLAMLLTDLVYAWLDPRIKAQYVSASAKKLKKEG